MSVSDKPSDLSLSLKLKETPDGALPYSRYIFVWLIVRMPKGREVGNLIQ